MKTIAVSMRMTQSESSNEWRDCIAQDWVTYLHTQGFNIQLIPNDPDHCRQYIANADMLILTGGDDIILHSADETSDSPKSLRDKTEYLLLEEALSLAKPIFGVCRGMQLINLYYKGTLKKIEGHVAQEHTVSVVHKNPFIETKEITVNSFHNLTIDTLGDDLETVAIGTDGSIEAIQNISLNLYGVMWHPERPFNQSESQQIHDNLFARFFE